MTPKIEKLEWDSDFFEIRVGQLNSDALVFCAHDLAEFDLLIDKSELDRTLEIDGFTNTFGECKLTFSKSIKKRNFSNKTPILDSDLHPITAEKLYTLAFESGKHSRFKLDKGFSNDKFEALYKKWIRNSINKTFASKIFYTEKNGEAMSFVTIKQFHDYAEFGLFAISSKHQGQGLGQQLMDYVEAYCATQNLKSIRIPTQKSNIPATNIYIKNGYTIHEQLFIKHYWKNK
ncbi:GNAT family N-acetyltransferase [Bizionia sediminis]|uniref:GNAT family N-acetyltransferase n=1 Tax=Bizionia sediminis TaxID=1737064 RepID=A0ABW5KRF1_9FLAO